MNKSELIMKVAEDAGQTSLVQLYTRQLAELNANIDLKQRQKDSLNAVIETLLSLGAHS